MSRYLNKDTPFFNNTTGEVLPFGVVYFGDPNTDPMDQVSNAKAPFEDRQLTVEADSVQTLTMAGKLEQRLYLSGPYAITVTDADGNVIDTDPYYVGESSDQITNDSGVTGSTISDALDALQSQINALSAAAVDLDKIYRIGQLYITTTNEHPGSFAGFGTWEAHGQGRVLVGVGDGTDANAVTQSFAAASTGGLYSVELTEANMAEHYHALFGGANGGSSALPAVSANAVASVDWQDYSRTESYRIVGGTTLTPTLGKTSSIGDGDPHTNVQPYIAVYFWKRIA